MIRERLVGDGHPHLAPAGWSLGRPLREYMVDGPLPTPQAVAVSLAVLSAVGSLHRAGRVHGGVSEDAVGIAPDGWVRLTTEAAREDRRGPRGDLHDTGTLLCRMLGAAPQEEPRLPSSEAEKTSPALVAVARTLAGGSGTWTAEAAWTAIKEAAGYWGSEPQLVRALADLAEAVDDDSTRLERAVTRIVIGPPLRSAPPPLSEKSKLALPELDVRRVLSLRPVLPALPTLPEVSIPGPHRPGRRFV